MGNVLSKMPNSTGRTSKNFPESSQHAAQTIYPFELLRYMLHFGRNCCVKCWQANGYCVIWFFFNARRVTTVFLPSTLTTCLTSNQNASRIAASTYTSGRIDQVQRRRSTQRFTEDNVCAATKVERKLQTNRCLMEWLRFQHATTGTLSSVWT